MEWILQPYNCGNCWDKKDTSCTTKLVLEPYNCSKCGDKNETPCTMQLVLQPGNCGNFWDKKETSCTTKLALEPYNCSKCWDKKETSCTMQLVLQPYNCGNCWDKTRIFSMCCTSTVRNSASRTSNQLLTVYIHLSPRERIRVCYAASVIAKVRSGQKVFVRLQPFGSQTISNLGTEHCYVT
jgi:hypothetical protein